jgi:ketosteroid isomerase-like protein
MEHGAEADRRAILEHVDRIFTAYIRKDVATIRATHAATWTGFQGPSTRIERGLDDYMRNAEASLRELDGTGYRLLDTELQLYGDIGVLYYLADYDYRDRSGRPGSLRLRSVDIYRREPGGWNQIGSHIAPIAAGGPWGPEPRPEPPRYAPHVPPR